MNDPDRVEDRAVRDATARSGGRVATAGGASCLAHDHIPITEFNRALPTEAVVDVPAIADWFEGRAHTVFAPPGYLGLEEQLAALGYEHSGAWTKFVRGVEPAPARTDLRIAENTDPEVFALTTSAGFGLDVELARRTSGLVGARGWHCFAAWDGDEPAGAGMLYAEGEWGWLGVGSTRPAQRGRGAQAALLAARIDRARELGLGRLVTETGSGGGPSYRNIVRAGFHPAYERRNWRSPR